ncbi:sulfotransferase [Aliifodinibius salicampi]|uniref:Sulfotransferase n=1 Tax=Fodinibius salicampi TaxID=1920655 RepID=A0ABT3PV66_9BACT|nr:sulfotransferase [Fodinibius salicampi]MCW9711728.1 sulfotransferase [Fodinibius salicampi]
MIDFFILSSPRSGSTFLRLNLDKLKVVTTLPETHFFGFYDRYKKIDLREEEHRTEAIEEWINWYKVKRLKINRQDLKKNLSDHVSGWKDILDLTIQFYLNDRGINREGILIGEKSSNHIFHQDHIKKFYPDAKIIYLVRDPRAIVASLKGCAWSTSNVVTNARVWRNGVREIDSMKPNFVIQYEKMIRTPEETMEKLSNFLNIEYVEDIFETKTEDKIEEESITSKNSLKPPSKEHINKWKNILSRTDRDIEIIEYICKEEMKNYGYKFEGGSYDFRFYSTLITQSMASYLAKFGKN